MPSARSPTAQADHAYSRAVRRAAAVFVLLTVEYLALALRFDGLLYRYSGWWKQLPHLVTFSIVTVTGVLVLSGDRVLSAVRAQAYTYEAPRLWPPMLAHGATVLLMLGLALTLERGDWSLAAFGATAAVFGVVAVASGLTALAAVLRPSALRALAWELREALVLGFVSGVLAFFVGLSAELLWQPMSSITLELTRLVLLGLGENVLAEPELKLLGLGEFVVEVAKECSGLEGMGLVLTFSGLYVWHHRAHLVFPRALLLVPFAVFATYLANIARIVALMWLGAHVSRDIAAGGFHSKAGWLFFCVVTLGIAALATRWRYVQRDRRVATDDRPAATTAPAAPYLMPFIAVTATALLTGTFTASAFDPLYVLRVLAALAVLYVYRRPLASLPRRVSAPAIAVGVAMFAAWLWLVPAPSPAAHSAAEVAMRGLGPAWGPAWLCARLVGHCVTVPIVEELAFRGFLYRRMVSMDFDTVSLSHRSALALLLSSLAFGALHQGAMLGAAVAGLAFAMAMLRRGSLGDAIVAHATTNILLAVYAVGWSKYAYL